ncbi:MAG: YceI family protein [Gemmatimonadetes bacterium]|jgi:polyisoprenoid-binding protein YceI|nr:YceI family protein [Gemmatimonadota bacterium]
MTAPATTTGTTTWTLDASHSSIEFSVKHLMITTVRGRFAEASGTATVPGDDYTKARVEVTIQAASLDTRSEQRDQHLRSADFFDVEQFPEITFRSTRLEGSRDSFRLTGDLTVHGVTKSVTLDVEFEGEGKDPWGGTRMGFSATTKIDRREFGLVWNQALETGGVMVSNDIKLQIEAQFVRA